MLNESLYFCHWSLVAAMRPGVQGWGPDELLNGTNAHTLSRSRCWYGWGVASEPKSNRKNLKAQLFIIFSGCPRLVRLLVSPKQLVFWWGHRSEATGRWNGDRKPSGKPTATSAAWRCCWRWHHKVRRKNRVFKLTPDYFFESIYDIYIYLYDMNWYDMI